MSSSKFLLCRINHNSNTNMIRSLGSSSRLLNLSSRNSYSCSRYYSSNSTSTTDTNATPDSNFNSYKVTTSVPRLSQHLLPATQTSSDDLLVRHGYIRQVAAGTYHLLPLGHMVQTNIENLLRKHMVSIGGVELSLSSFSNPKLWEKTGRIDNAELFKISDSRGTVSIVAPTHEEEITNLVASTISSYRKLPLRLFQITRKYRDEKRPRGGLLRGREFLMKDMYSFDESVEAAHDTYADVQRAYKGFFEELRVPFVVAEADSGSIGGTLSHEYHYLTPAGEDNVVTCPECKYTANVEKALAHPPDDLIGSETREAAVSYHVSPDRETLIAAYYPPDREFNVLHLVAELPEDTVDMEVAEVSESENEIDTGKNKSSEESNDNNTTPYAVKLFLDAAKKDDDEDLFTRRFIRVMDPHLSRETPLPKLPFKPHRGATTTLIDVPLVMAQAGDVCPSCEEPSLEISKAVEVGHTFYLGTKYSTPLGATITTASNTNSNEKNKNKNNKIQETKNSNDTITTTTTTITKPIEMGCYGIGVSRLIAAIISHTKDKDGLVWPASISPYHAVVVSRDSKVGELIVSKLRSPSLSSSSSNFPYIINAVLDDRIYTQNLSFSSALHSARSLGFPITIVAGSQFEKTGMVEIQMRNLTIEEIKKSVVMKKSNNNNENDNDNSSLYTCTIDQLNQRLYELLKL